MEQQALRYHEYGKPDEVLRLERMPVADPTAGEVRVRLVAAAINPSDYGMIAGSYGRLLDLPAVAGREGVGEIEAVGEGVTGLSVGARVRFPADAGAWRETVCTAADALAPVPAEVPVEQAALSFINPPTAWCLLHEVSDLKAGDWIVQNAANSAVGIAVIQLAREMGVRTLNMVRREELMEPLKAMGADEVVIEGSGWHKQVKDLTRGGTVKVALNSIGGASAIDQIKVLGEGGVQFTFGGMVGDPVRFPTRFLIFNDVQLRGFWWDRWTQRASGDAVRRVMAAVHARMASGVLELPVEATYPFSEYQAALAHDQRPRLGKVLLRPPA